MHRRASVECPVAWPCQRYRMRTPSTGREIIIEAEPGPHLPRPRDRRGARGRRQGRSRSQPSPSQLPWAVENLRFCNWCDQLAQKDLNDCPTCGRRMAPLGASAASPSGLPTLRACARAMSSLLCAVVGRRPRGRLRRRQRRLRRCPKTTPALTAPPSGGTTHAVGLRGDHDARRRRRRPRPRRPTGRAGHRRRRGGTAGTPAPGATTADAPAATRGGAATAAGADGDAGDAATDRGDAGGADSTTSAQRTRAPASDGWPRRTRRGCCFVGSPSAC